MDVFSVQGLRGATLEQIASESGVSKQNILYHFGSKDAIYTDLLESLLDHWLSPMRDLSEDGEPLEEILTYVRRKLQMSYEMPRESRLFANDILQGAPRISPFLDSKLRDLFEEKCALITRWSEQNRIAKVDARHLFFSIWATTQHYADFDTQVTFLLEGQDKDGSEDHLCTLFRKALSP